MGQHFLGNLWGRIVWHRQGGMYKTSILGYTALITEQEERKFKARIEDDSGTVLRDWERDPVEFEEAEQWVILSAVELEQTANTDIAQRGMNETLDLCQPLLVGSAHPTHLQRLANIGEWARGVACEHQQIVGKEGSHVRGLNSPIAQPPHAPHRPAKPA